MKNVILSWNISKLRTKGDDSQMYGVLTDTVDCKYLQKKKDSSLNLKM